MTAPDSRDSVERVLNDMHAHDDSPEMCVFYDRLQALARGPQQAGGEYDWKAAHEALESMDDFARMDKGVAPHGPYAVLRDLLTKAKAWKESAEAAEAALREESARLDYIERTFSGMTNRERYLPVQMIWGKGCNGRTLREACDKYRKRDAAIGGTGDA